jgi:hypothetical protein
VTRVARKAIIGVENFEKGTVREQIEIPLRYRRKYHSGR